MSKKIGLFITSFVIAFLFCIIGLHVLLNHKVKSFVAGDIIAVRDNIVVVSIPGENATVNFQFNDKTAFFQLDESNYWMPNNNISPALNFSLGVFYVNNLTNPPTLIDASLLPVSSDINNSGGSQ